MTQPRATFNAPFHTESHMTNIFLHTVKVNPNLPSQNPVPSHPHETDTMGENENATVTTKKKTSKTLLTLLTEPFQWIQKLSSQLNPTFVIGVFLIYGIGQGFSGSLFKVATHCFLLNKY